MKKIMLFLIFLFSTVHLTVAQLKSQVNECFELTSIVFRLAGAEEYVNNAIVEYAKDIDLYFGKYKDHKLITHIQEIRQKHAIGYNAVSTAAALIEIKNGKVLIRSEVDISKINEIDHRWTEHDFKKYLDLLNDFYRKTKFRNFYTKHGDLYKLAENRMNEILQDFNVDWFKTLFKQEVQPPEVMISLCNGRYNYALSSAKHYKNGMVISCGSDKEGLPFFQPGVLTIVAHEFLHHYVNPLVYEYWDQIDPAAQIIYPYVKEDMAKLAYGSAKTTIIEWFANLLVVMYIQDNPIPRLSTEMQIGSDQNRGFIWMDRSVTFMEHFQNNRDLFATIDDYMPQMVGFLTYTATNFEHIVQEFTNRHPYITDIFPSRGCVIDPDIDRITIRFSEPMSNTQRIVFGVDENIIPPPVLSKPKWDSDKQTYVITLHKSKLEKGKTYGFKLVKNGFKSVKSYAMQEDYIYTFKITEP